MSNIARSRVVIPASLSAAQRQALGLTLYKIQTQIFAGVDYATFFHYVVESCADKTWILIHENAAGEIVGYCALHIFERTRNGRSVGILRAEAGMLHAYRGHNANARFGFFRFAWYALRNFDKPIYYLGSLVHPSSYSLFAALTTQLHPNAQCETPPDLARLLSELGDEFGLPRVDAADPLVREVGWRTRDSKAEARYWRRSHCPRARFFVERNPGYDLGHGLLTLVPISFLVLLVGAWRLCKRALFKKHSSIVARLSRVALLSRLFQPSQRRIKDLLSRVPMFARTDGITLSKLARGVDVVCAPPGTTLLQEGESGEHMYILLRGCVHIMNGRAEGERVIDELGSGEWFGEMALLTDQPRTATVRTVKSATLLRLHRSALHLIMSARHSIEQRIWSVHRHRRAQLASVPGPGPERSAEHGLPRSLPPLMTAL